MIEIRVDKRNRRTDMVIHGTKYTVLGDFRILCRTLAEHITDGCLSDADRYHIMHELLDTAEKGIREGCGSDTP